MDDEICHSLYSFEEVERNNFNDSAKTVGFSPIKPVGKRDIYGQQKAKCMKTVLTEKLAEALDIAPIDLCETSSDKNYTNCKDLDKLVELMKEKLKVVSGKEQIRILTLAPILAEPNTKMGKKLNEDVCKFSNTFFTTR